MLIDKVAPVKTLVQEGLYLLMEPLGYTLEGNNLTKMNHSSSVELIEFHVNPNMGERFTVTLGVHYPEIMKQVLRIPAFCEFKAQLKPLRSSACAFQQDLAELALGKARWWKLEAAGPNLKKLVEQLTILILEGGLPWLRAHAQPSVLLENPERDDIFALMAARLSHDEATLQKFWRRFQSQPKNQDVVKQVETFLWPT